MDGFRCHLSSSESSNSVESKEGDEEGGGLSRKRGRDQAEAESHYDSLKRNKNDRFRSRIFHMRNLNNWIKVVLIEQGVQQITPPLPPETLRVLDLGCGKGGDFNKWVMGEGGVAEYSGVDIAKVSLQDLVSDRASE